jgi:uncharacterized protein (DUF1800 family)
MCTVVPRADIAVGAADVAADVTALGAADVAVDGAADSPPAPPARSRRSFFFLGALAAASLLPGRSGAQSVRRPSTTRARPRPFDESAFGTVLPETMAVAPDSWGSPTMRLVRRATMGLNAAETTVARSIGYQGWLHRQLNYTRLDDRTVEARVATLWPLLSQTPEQLFAANATTVRAQLQEATLYRAIMSPRQLYERMVEFWSDHFNIQVLKVGYLKVLDDRDVIRRHAMGNFRDLVHASAKSAAMLVYLDQNISRVGRPNENYARELMELHTVGVDGGYTQTDVSELARVLTGWTTAGRGGFNFDPTGHDWGQKVVMGLTIPASSPAVGAAGVREGEQVIDMLVNHPATARFISTKLLQWLLTPQPTESQVATVASAFRASRGDIRTVVRAVLNEGWLMQAPLKYKRPFHFMASALRGVDARITSLAAMNTQLTTVGQPLFYWETPDGYPDQLEYWAGNILPRWNLASSISTLRSITTIQVDHEPFLRSTADASIDAIDTALFGGEMPLGTRNALLTYLRGGTLGETRVRETLALAMSCNAFQWY